MGRLTFHSSSNVQRKRAPNIFLREKAARKKCGNETRRKAEARFSAFLEKGSDLSGEIPIGKRERKKGRERRKILRSARSARKVGGRPRRHEQRAGRLAKGGFKRKGAKDRKEREMSGFYS